MLLFHVGDVMNICEHSGKYKELPEVFSEVNTELLSLGLRYGDLISFLKILV